MKEATITIEHDDGKKLVFTGVVEYAIVGSQRGPGIKIPVFMHSAVGYLPTMLGHIHGLKEHVERWPTMTTSPSTD